MSYRGGSECVAVRHGMTWEQVIAGGQHYECRRVAIVIASRGLSICYPPSMLTCSPPAIALLSPSMLTCSPPAIALLSPQHAHLLAASDRSAIPPATAAAIRPRSRLLPDRYYCSRPIAIGLLAPLLSRSAPSASDCEALPESKCVMAGTGGCRRAGAAFEAGAG